MKPDTPLTYSAFTKDNLRATGFSPSAGAIKRKADESDLHTAFSLPIGVRRPGRGKRGDGVRVKARRLRNKISLAGLCPIVASQSTATGPRTGSVREPLSKSVVGDSQLRATRLLAPAYHKSSHRRDYDTDQA